MSEKIAELEIQIVDNATGAAESIGNLKDALVQLKANSDTGLQNTASQIQTFNTTITGMMKARNTVATMSKATQAAVKAMRQQSAEVQKMANQSGIQTMSKQLDDVSQKMSDMTPSTLSSSMDRASDSVREIAHNTETAKRSMDGFKKSTDSASQSVEKAKKSTRTVMGTLSGVRKGFGNLSNSILSTGLSFGRFMRMFEMRLLRVAVKAVFDNVRQGLENVYYWSKATGDQFATSMDTITSSTAYMRNSLGAAFASLLNNLAPIFESIVDWVVQVINYINMFFAVLNGQSTYTRAKKQIVEYGKAATGAIGGATGAAQDLKEALTVLDFDELHQLQEASVPSGGGGGGGGGGGTGTNYNDMFEKAPIENNWLTRTANWLKENFDDVLDTVKAIGLGILAWKLSNAFSNALGGLLSLKQTMGITFMVTGATMVYDASKDIALEGFDLENGIRYALGSALGISGALLTFGTGPLGWAVGFTIVLTATIIGAAEGNLQKIKNRLYEENESYRFAVDSIQRSADRIQKARDAVFNVKTVDDVITDDQVLKWTNAADLLSKIKSFDGKIDLSEGDLTELQTYIDDLNAILAEAGLDEYVSFWVDANNQVHTQTQNLDNVIRKMLQLAKIDALKGLYGENSAALLEQRTELKKGQTDMYTNAKALRDAKEQQQWLMDIQGALLGEEAIREKYGQDFIDFAQQNYTYGQDVPGKTNVETQLTDLSVLMEGYKEGFDKAKESVDECSYAIGELEQANADIEEEINNTTLELNKQEQAADGATEAIYNLRKALDFNASDYGLGGAINAVKYGLTPKDAQKTDFSDYVASLTGKNSGRPVKDPNVTENGKQERMSGQEMAIDLDATRVMRTASAIDGVISDIGGGMNLTNVQNELNSTFDPEKYAVKGQEVKSAIETPINTITANGNLIGTQVGGSITKYNYGGVADNVKSILQTGINKTTANGSTIGGQVGTAIKKYNYGGIADSVKSTLQTGINKTSANGNTIGGQVKTAITGYNHLGTGTTVASKIGEGINKVGSYVNVKTMMSSMQSSMIKQAAGFHKVGQLIGDGIIQGIRSAVGTLTFTTTATAGNTTKKVVGKINTDIRKFYAEGGFPQTGEIYVAREAGSEMIGRIGSRNAVANNDQIANAIAKALTPLLGQGGGTSTTTVNVKLDSATIARANLKGQRAMNKQYNIVAQA